MQPASNTAKISDEIARIEAGGGTTMYPAMEMSFEMLMAASAKLKHVILLTDGISSPGDFEGAASKMASNRITLSTVGIGHGAHQEVLERIARLAGGRYYFCNEPQAVPQIFAKETVTASKSAIHEEPFLPQLMRPTPVLSEIDFEAAPFLLGYVVTRAKPTSELILASEKGEPILAWWRYGLGMCAAFTSDAKNRWAAEWTTWPDFGKFWAQVVRHVMRKNETNGAVVDIRRQGSQVDVLLDAVDAHGQFINQADTSLTVLDPQLQRQQMAMSQVAPGRYKATFAAPQSGTYHLELAQHSAGQQTFHQTRGLVVGYADELRLRPTNQPLLTKIAEVSGGRYAADAKSIFLPDGRTAPRAEPLWPYLLSAVALLFVLDVALRRIDFSRFRPLWRPRMGALASVLPSR
jgi:hypothetical protein